MTTFELKYNSFAVKTDFFVDGKKADLKCLGTGYNVRLRDYIKDFFPEAIKKSNVGPGEPCIIQFYGTQDAFEDVKKSYEEYMAQANNLKIELPEYKPYPNNFNEMNKLIDDKRDFFNNQIKHKKEELINPSSRKKNIELTDVIKKFDRDKKKIEQITYSDCLDKANSVIEKAKEGVNFNTSIEPMNNLDRIFSVYNTSNNNLLTIDANKVKFYDSKNYVVENEYAKLYYDKIKEQINLIYTKSYGELTDLLVSLFEKINTALYSGVEAVYKDYTAAYSDFLVLNHSLIKYKQNKSFGIKDVIPDSCFSGMEIKATSSTVRIGVALINEAVNKVTSSCQEYFNSVFEAAKQAFLNEAEKCKAYYLEQLQEFQETVKEKLSSTKQIEQEILLLKTKIECLDELQNEINRVIKG